MYLLKKPIVTIYLDHKNPHPLPAKQVVTLEDFLTKYRSFLKIAPTKIAKMKTYHEPNNTMASNIKVMNWV